MAGNVAILLLVASKKKMHSATNIFIGLLAFGDLLIVLFCMPFTVPALYIFEVSLPPDGATLIDPNHRKCPFRDGSLAL